MAYPRKNGVGRVGRGFWGSFCRIRIKMTAFMGRGRGFLGSFLR